MVPKGGESAMILISKSVGCWRHQSQIDSRYAISQGNMTFRNQIHL